MVILCETPDEKLRITELLTESGMKTHSDFAKLFNLPVNMSYPKAMFRMGRWDFYTSNCGTLRTLHKASDILTSNGSIFYRKVQLP